MLTTSPPINYHQLAQQIKQWGRELGFQQVGITDTDLTTAEQHLQEWLDKGFHGELTYMEKHGTKRSRPAELVPGTVRIISVRMDYLPPDVELPKQLANQDEAYISCYARGRDYHKVIRKRLQQLAEQITGAVGEFGYRAFVDSAPVLEKPIAAKAGLGWQGKHTLLLNRQAGSWFFLGELYTDLPLPIDQPETDHCGKCKACMKVCPTQAIVAPYQLDARRCISYLTIEYKGVIPEEFRPLLGNRIFGCDDCQLICPWNRFADFTQETDFHPRHVLDDMKLLTLFNWTETEYLANTQGSAIRRTGYQGWLRNIAIALGNAPYHPDIVKALNIKLNHPSELVIEHVQWALQQQLNKAEE